MTGKDSEEHQPKLQLEKNLRMVPLVMSRGLTAGRKVSFDLQILYHASLPAVNGEIISWL